MTRTSMAILLIFTLSAAPAARATLPTPTRLPSTPVAAGALHAYQLQGGVLKGFGYDGDGRMGIGWTSNSRLTPQAIPNFTDVAQVSVGNAHTLALKKDGTVWAWGYNSHGQVGDGTTNWVNTPVKLAGLVGIKKVVARDMSSFALASDGKLYAWGANTAGQLGLGTFSDALTPTRVTGGLPAVVDVGLGSQHVIVADTTGAVWSWGANNYGQLGDNTTTTQTSPKKLTALTGINQVSAGGNFSVAVNSAGQLWAWGRGAEGQTGTGSLVDRRVPIKITALPDVNMVVAGTAHALALRKNAEVWAWGDNSQGQQGRAGGNRLRPGRVVDLPATAAIAAGDNNSFATSVNGEVMSWGANSNGILGLGFSSQFEVTARKAAAVRFPYTVLFAPVGTYSTAEINQYKADAARLAVDIDRLSYGQLQLNFEYAGPFAATSAQAGCQNADNDDRTVFIYAINHAAAAGYDLSKYGTIISGWGSNLIGGCKLGSNWATSAKQTAPTNPLAMIWQTTAVQLGTGFRWMGRGTRDNLEFIYGFELGFGTLTATNPSSLNSSVSRLRCDGTVIPSTTACAFNSLVFRGMYTMAAPIAVEPNEWPWAHANDTLSMKVSFGWLGSSDVSPIDSTKCTTRLNIIPLETRTRPPNTTYGAKIAFPVPANSASPENSLFIEYRNDVRIGPNLANRPGVFATFYNGLPFLLQLELDAANAGGDAPTRVGTTYKLADTYTLLVNAVGVDGTGVDRADVTITNTSPSCQ